MKSRIFLLSSSEIFHFKFGFPTHRSTRFNGGKVSLQFYVSVMWVSYWTAWGRGTGDLSTLYTDFWPILLSSSLVLGASNFWVFPWFCGRSKLTSWLPDNQLGFKFSLVFSITEYPSGFQLPKFCCFCVIPFVLGFYDLKKNKNGFKKINLVENKLKKQNKINLVVCEEAGVKHRLTHF